MHGNKTIKQYETNAEAHAAAYESADVGDLQQQILTSIKGCDSVLEIGCGSGRDAAFLMKYSTIESFTITDGSETMLSQAAVLHPELINHLALLKLPYGLKTLNRKFQGVYSIATLMHLSPQHITEALSLISGILFPEGVLFISVCTERNKQPAGDLRLFTLKSVNWWVEQLENSGLKVTQTTKSSDGLHRTKTVWVNITAVKSFTARS